MAALEEHHLGGAEQFWDEPGPAAGAAPFCCGPSYVLSLARISLGR